MCVVAHTCILPIPVIPSLMRKQHTCVLCFSHLLSQAPIDVVTSGGYSVLFAPPLLNATLVVCYAAQRYAGRVLPLLMQSEVVPAASCARTWAVLLHSVTGCWRSPTAAAVVM